MNTKKEFNRIMNGQKVIALATCNNSAPNVRIVNFYYDENNSILYFSTFDDNKKVEELLSNNTIAFTTIPDIGVEHIRGKSYARKSKKTIFDLKNEFCNKIPYYENTIEFAGEDLILFEVEITEVVVTLDFENIESFSV